MCPVVSANYSYMAKYGALRSVSGLIVRSPTVLESGGYRQLSSIWLPGRCHMMHGLLAVNMDDAAVPPTLIAERPGIDYMNAPLR